MSRILIFLLICFQVTALVTLSLLSFTFAKKQGTVLSLPYPTELFPILEMQKTLPSSSGKVVGSSITAEDARTLIVERFIKRFRHDSPMLPYADEIVEEADKNSIDFRLVPAIAMCESNLGSRLPSSDSYNAWGIAVYTNTLKGKHFNNWTHAISWVSNYLREKFYSRGITSLYDIGAIWAPPSVDNNYSWTRCVQGFMDKME
jgi:hypothetical protein